MNKTTTNQTDGKIIEITGLEKHFRSGGDQVKAVDGVNVSFPRGKMIAIRGASGSGKSTLLNLIGALDKPSAGTIMVDGLDVSKMRGSAEVKYRLQKVGFVFQSYCLIPNLSALENAMMPIELLDPHEKQGEEKAKKLLDRVGIDKTKIMRRPAKLSGGEQQRVAIARALANDPPIILADEPTGNLDSKNGRRIVELLRSLTKDGKTVLIATHDSEIAAGADMIIDMMDGKIVSN
jgi:ABC-type lipoprotein export system ATPase subunit